MSTYALDTLLALRQRAEEEAAAVLARAIATAVAAQQLQEALARETTAAGAAWERARAPADSQRAAEPATETVAQHHFAGRLAAAASRKRQQLARHRVGVVAPALRAEHEARQAYVRARHEREAVERHRDRQQADARALAERRQQDG